MLEEWLNDYKKNGSGDIFITCDNILSTKIFFRVKKRDGLNIVNSTDTIKIIKFELLCTG